MLNVIRIGLCFFMLLLIFSCKKVHEETIVKNERMASFKIEANSFKSNNPYLGIFDDNGIISNTLVLDNTDGSQIEINFTGVTSGAHNLESGSDAFYKDSEGHIFNGVNGQLVISSYIIEGNIYKSSGIFHFKAKMSTAPFDSLEITDGSFTNASNEL